MVCYGLTWLFKCSVWVSLAGYWRVWFDYGLALLIIGCFGRLWAGVISYWLEWLVMARCHCLWLGVVIYVYGLVSFVVGSSGWL